VPPRPTQKLGKLSFQNSHWETGNLSLSVAVNAKAFIPPEQISNGGQKSPRGG